MKSFFGAVLFLALTGPQVASAAASPLCNMDDLGARAYMSPSDELAVMRELSSKGYTLSEEAPKEFTMMITEGSLSETGMTCTRNVSFYGARVEGNLPARPLYNVSVSSLGETPSEACSNALKAAFKMAPTCKVIKKRAQK